MILQNITGNGIGGVSGVGDGLFNDSTFIDVHCQSCTGDGFYILNQNVYLLGCRADACANGFTVNAAAAGTGFVSVILAACGTEGNNKNGLNVINTSGTGQSSRSPVLVNGCMFSADGSNSGSGGGGYAGIYVSGRNVVTISNTHVLVGTAAVVGGAPQYGIATASAGTGPGVPLLVSVTGGLISGATQPFNDAAPAGPALRVDSSVAVITGTSLTTFGIAPAPNNTNLTQPAGSVIASTIPRWQSTIGLPGFTSGQVQLCAIGLNAGQTTQAMTAFTAGAAKTGGTHGWYVLLDKAFNVVAVTADKTDASTVWGSTNTAYQLSWAAPYTAEYTGDFYAGIMVAESAGTMPTFRGSAALGTPETAGTGVSGPVVFCGASSSGQSTPPAIGATLTTVSSDGTRAFYAYLT